MSTNVFSSLMDTSARELLLSFATILPDLDTALIAQSPWDQASLIVEAVHSSSDLSHFEKGRTSTPATISANLLTPPRVKSDRSQSNRKGFVERLIEHLNYLRSVSSGARSLISPETAKQAMLAWCTMWEATGFALPIPDACTGPDGKMLYSWDRGKDHLELEIIPGQASEFFYRDRESGYLWGEDYIIGEPLSQEALKRIKLFI